MSIASGSERRAVPTERIAETTLHRASDGVSRMELPVAAPSMRAPPLELDIVRLRVRMEALEHLVILLLGSASHQDLEAVRELKHDVDFRHSASLDSEMSRAAAQMIRLVERSDGLRPVAAADY